MFRTALSSVRFWLLWMMIVKIKTIRNWQQKQLSLKLSHLCVAEKMKIIILLSSHVNSSELLYWSTATRRVKERSLLTSVSADHIIFSMNSVVSLINLFFTHRFWMSMILMSIQTLSLIKRSHCSEMTLNVLVSEWTAEIIKIDLSRSQILSWLCTFTSVCHSYRWIASSNCLISSAKRFCLHLSRSRHQLASLTVWSHSSIKARQKVQFSESSSLCLITQSSTAVWSIVR